MSRILRSPGNAWRELPVERTGLLVDGDDYYRAFYSAAQRAEHYILLAGWQFDSDACLLRGEAAKGAPLPVSLLEFLDALCDRRPGLRIFVLAWDFHSVFALEREWMQELRFNWATNDRLTFRFDSAHADSGSHHQKFVVIDGQLSFLGGLDLCDHRWDDRCHKDPNPLRVSRGEPHKPFHDVQAYLVGREVACALEELFCCRWKAAGGDDLGLERSERPWTGDFVHALPLEASRVALSRTDPHGSPTKTEDCREIRDLYFDAIARAERLIYIETQYFSSCDIGPALAERLRDPRGSLDVVLVLNMEAETFKEEVAVGLAQAKVISDLRKAAEGTAHRLGVYYTMPECQGEAARATYIHSKLMIVDDRFLTVGSANLTNRSTWLDTELNASVETEDAGDALGQSIVRARESLLEEHLGAPVNTGEGLVTVLDRLAAAKASRLRLHPSPTEREREILGVVDPAALPFDPTAPEEHPRTLFSGGLGKLWAKVTGGK
jgi:phospholipase D1/2